MIQKMSLKISASAQMFHLDLQDKLNKFLVSEESVKGTTEEGTNVYGTVVTGMIMLAVVFGGLRLIFGGIMGDFQDGTTKMPAKW